MTTEENFHYITTVKELKKYVNKPIMLISKNGLAWVMIFKNLYKPSIEYELVKFPYNYLVIGTHMIYMSDNIYVFKTEKPCVCYSQPLTDLCQLTVQKKIRTLTYEEMKEYKKCVHKAMFDGVEKMKTVFRAKSIMYRDSGAKKMI